MSRLPRRPEGLPCLQPPPESSPGLAASRSSVMLWFAPVRGMMQRAVARGSPHRRRGWSGSPAGYGHLPRSVLKSWRFAREFFPDRTRLRETPAARFDDDRLARSPSFHRETGANIEGAVHALTQV